MKRENIEEMVHNYYSETVHNVDTKGLLNMLKPAIEHKCEVLKTKKNNITETFIFILSCIAVFTIGVFILFPEIIDYSDTITEFFILGLAAGFILTAINLTVKGLLPNSIDDRNAKLRGKLS